MSRNIVGIEVPESLVIQEVVYNQMPRGRLFPLQHGYWLETLEEDEFIYQGMRCRSNVPRSSQPIAVVQKRPWRALVWGVGILLAAAVWTFAIIGVLSVIHG